MTLLTRQWKTVEVDEEKAKRKHEKVISQLYKVNTEQNINNILLINMTQSCQIKHFTCILRLLNNTCVKHNFKRVHVSNHFWSREYNSAKEICKYPSFSKVGGNYPLDLEIIWSSVHVVKSICDIQGFQYFSNAPVLHYLQEVLFIKIWTIFMNILYNTL